MNGVSGRTLAIAAVLMLAVALVPQVMLAADTGPPAIEQVQVLSVDQAVAAEFTAEIAEGAEDQCANCSEWLQVEQMAEAAGPPGECTKRSGEVLANVLKCPLIAWVPRKRPAG